MKKVVKIVPFIVALISLLAIAFAYGANTARLSSAIYGVICVALLGVQYYNKNKNRGVTLFLVFLILAEVISIIILGGYFDIVYHSVNILYIISYGCLVYFLITQLDIKVVSEKFKYFTLVLLCFFVFLMWYLNMVMVEDHEITMWSLEYVVETAYNFIIILFLMVSFLNFIYYDSKKELLLFLFCIAIVFSEMIQLTYIYIIKNKVLYVLMAVFRISAFYALYYYVSYKGKENSEFDLLD